MDPQKIKDLKIKSGVVKRLAKEKVSYEQEAAKQQEKIDGMKQAGDQDEYVIKKQLEVLDESRRMVPDCERRLITAWDELSKLVESEVELQEAPEYQLAKAALEETRVAARR
jgi:tubulin-specific chaperone A